MGSPTMNIYFWQGVFQKKKPVVMNFPDESRAENLKRVMVVVR